MFPNCGGPSGSGDGNVSCDCAGGHSGSHLGIGIDGERGRGDAAESQFRGLSKASAGDYDAGPDLAARRGKAGDDWRHVEGGGTGGSASIGGDCDFARFAGGGDGH